MYKFLKFNVISAITLSTFMYAGSAFAEGCNEGSPNRISQGEAYFDLDLVANPSDKEKALLGAFVKSILGEWNGALTELECFGPANNPRPVHTDSDVQVKITEGLNNALSLNHEAYYSDEKKTSLRSIDALGENNLFSLVFFEEDTVSFSEKSRRNNGNSGNFNGNVNGNGNTGSGNGNLNGNNNYGSGNGNVNGNSMSVYVDIIIDDF